MEYINKFPGLKHFNREELLSIVNYNEDHMNLLLKTFFEEFQKNIKSIRYAIIKKNYKEFNQQSKLLIKAANAVCFEIMVQLATEVSECELTDTECLKDLLETIEVECEHLKDLLDKNLVFAAKI